MSTLKEDYQILCTKQEELIEKQSTSEKEMVKIRRKKEDLNNEINNIKKEIIELERQNCQSFLKIDKMVSRINIILSAIATIALIITITNVSPILSGFILNSSIGFLISSSLVFLPCYYFFKLIGRPFQSLLHKMEAKRQINKYSETSSKRDHLQLIEKEYEDLSNEYNILFSESIDDSIKLENIKGQIADIKNQLFNYVFSEDDSILSVIENKNHKVKKRKYE